MGRRDRRLDPFQAIFGQRQLSKKGGAGGQRVDSRTNIVNKARQGQFRRTASAANRLVRFKNQDRAASLRQLDRRSQAIGPRANDNCIITGIFEVASQDDCSVFLR